MVLRGKEKGSHERFPKKVGGLIKKKFFAKGFLKSLWKGF